MNSIFWNVVVCLATLVALVQQTKLIKHTSYNFIFSFGNVTKT